VPSRTREFLVYSSQKEKSMILSSKRSPLNSLSVRTLAGVALFLVVTVISSSAQTLTTLIDFNGTNGLTPYAPPVQGRDGNFYGTTGGGGANSGTIFKITPDGTLTTLHQFTGSDGDGPVAPLVLGVDGNFYGTAEYGGSGSLNGTVFRITPEGQFNVLYQFCSPPNCPDGYNAAAGLVQGPDGNFYGATVGGGTGNIYNGGGTIYKISPTGKLTTLYSFCSLANCADGMSPYDGLTLGTNGLLYGTTAFGGANGQGTLFEISLSGKLTTLFNFKGFVHGPAPDASALTQASDGSFYGTTYNGGSKSGGSVFRFSQHGGFKAIYTFCSQPNCADGGNPPGGLVLGSDGNFYGTTAYGGAYSDGTIFQITPAGQLTTLYSFCPQPMSGCTDGSRPESGLTQGTDGSFYGSTIFGGTTSLDGTIFKFSSGLGPLVKAIPDFGKANSTVTILGNNLMGTTSVTFNGIAATFHVVSATYIRAVVPTGATTGTIQVTTPSGTLSSAVAFEIVP
jgi:uncharacterized repeat protein (TIGR03803 family)